MRDFARLVIRIEKLRSKMHQLAENKGFGHEDVVKVSQQLDALLNEYYRQKSSTI